MQTERIPRLDPSPHTEREQTLMTTMTSWKEAITRRFNAAAGTYDLGAESQRRIASELCRRVRQEHLPDCPRVLEIGCGTGYLTKALLPEFPGCHWIATDIAPRMVELCAARLEGRITVRVMDGEYPDLGEQRFDLIVSSLAVQWFTDLAAGLRRLHGMLGPGGLLAVTTLGSGTFQEWRDACHGAGVDSATPPYPSPDSLRGMLGSGAQVLQQVWPLSCTDLHDFLNHLKTTGARAAPGHAPLSAAVLHRILRTCNKRPFIATYDVLTVLWQKEP
jgi:malonyl-CoA O-methyltransferase